MTFLYRHLKKDVVRLFLVFLAGLTCASLSAACDIPTLLTPPDDSPRNLGPYTLDWEAVVGATGYYLDVVGEPNPPNPYFVTESEFSSVWDGPHCPMLWRVRAVCGADTSDYSETWAIWVACTEAAEGRTWFAIKSLFRV